MLRPTSVGTLTVVSDEAELLADELRLELVLSLASDEPPQAVMRQALRTAASGSGNRGWRRRCCAERVVMMIGVTGKPVILGLINDCCFSFRFQTYDD